MIETNRGSSANEVNVAKVEELFGRGPEEEEFTTLGGFLAARARIGYLTNQPRTIGIATRVDF